MTERPDTPADDRVPAAGSPFDTDSAGAASRLVRRTSLVVVVAGAALAAWRFTRVSDPAQAMKHAAPAVDAGSTPVMLTAEGAQRIGVTYAVVERGSLATDVRAVGVVTWDETQVKVIAPKLDGWVEQLHVAFVGQPVEPNDPLLRIYSPMLVTAEEELLLAKKLAADVGAGNADAARNAEALLAAARRRLRYWDIPDDEIARVERTGEVERTFTLRSPLGGVVVQKTVQSGQRIMAGEAVYQVADLHEVWLEGEVFEQDVAVIRLGQRVTVEFVAQPGAPHEARVVFIAPTVAAESRTVKVRMALPNPGLALRPGMYATIHLLGAPRANQLHIPRSAVLVTGKRSLVFVKGAGGVLTPREVALGASTDERVEILRGVAAGDTVVASATFLVDAESNLGSAPGAMAGMAGMDALPPKVGGAKPADPMAGMPGVDRGKNTTKKP